jgi:hypothetical protein
MKRDKLLKLLADIIVWCEDLRYEVQRRRFERAVEAAKNTPSQTKIFETKIIDQQGYVLTTTREVKPDDRRIN